MFDDRRQAGISLAAKLKEVVPGGADTLVLALPRGGLPVAAPIAAELGSELDVILVRKVGHPRQPELALGALGEGGVLFLNRELLAHVRVSDEQLNGVIEAESLELERRADLYRAGRSPRDMAGRHVVIVDDGIATGATALAAEEVAREAGAQSVIVAAPVAPHSAQARFENLVTVESPTSMGSVGEFYRDFRQVTDEEVMSILGGDR